MPHQIEDVEIEEEQYDENADEDFNPDGDAADEEVSSSSEDEAAVATKKPSKKRKAGAVEGALDSGDEETITERKTKRRRRKGGAKDDGATVVDGDEESAGEGGLIKTRAQRLAEKVERKQRRRETVGEVTIDVDSVWAELSSLPIGRQSGHIGAGGDTQDDMEIDVDEGNKENVDSALKAGTTGDVDEDEMITITRRIEYAGEVTEVMERVPRSSKEAQQYLATRSQNQTEGDRPSETLHRPLKRPSIFEPNPTALIKNVLPTHPILRGRAPSRADVLLAQTRVTEELEKKRKAERMTTVQKSALDWKGFVAGQEGLQEELEGYGKSKKTFLERQDFLGRADMARERIGKEVRMLG